MSYDVMGELRGIHGRLLSLPQHRIHGLGSNQTHRSCPLVIQTFPSINNVVLVWRCNGFAASREK